MLCYSPLTYSQHIAKSKNFLACAYDYEFDSEAYWRAHGMAMLQACDAVLLVRYEGWTISEGVDAELAYANQHNKDIYHMYTDPGGIELAMDEVSDDHAETGFNVNDNVEKDVR